MFHKLMLEMRKFHRFAWLFSFAIMMSLQFMLAAEFSTLSEKKKGRVTLYFQLLEVGLTLLWVF